MAKIIPRLPAQLVAGTFTSGTAGCWLVAALALLCGRTAFGTWPLEDRRDRRDRLATACPDLSSSPAQS
jgi:hypothetical protein